VVRRLPHGFGNIVRRSRFLRVWLLVGLLGDLFMRLIRTSQSCGANWFEYLTELQQHAQELENDRAGLYAWP
jgi:hypothetical protein